MIRSRESTRVRSRSKPTTRGRAGEEGTPAIPPLQSRPAFPPMPRGRRNPHNEPAVVWVSSTSAQGGSRQVAPDRRREGREVAGAVPVDLVDRPAQGADPVVPRQVTAVLLVLAVVRAVVLHSHPA